MSRTVQVRGDKPVFPGDACAHCLRPATSTVDLIKVKRSAVRRLGVPFCDECLALRRAKSTFQIRFERAGLAVSFLLAWALGIWTYVFVLEWHILDGDYGWAWAALLGALVVVSVFGLLHLIVRPWSRRYRTPETKAVLETVRIRNFDWDTTTLEFADEAYAERFARVNEMTTAASTPQREVAGE